MKNSKNKINKLNQVNQTKIRFCKHSGCTTLIKINKDSTALFCASHIPIICVFPQCKKVAINRIGLCDRHLEVAKNLIEHGLTSWQELYRQGKIKVMP